MPELATTNTWLAVLAVSSAIQTLLLLGVAIALFTAYRRATEAFRGAAEALERLEQRAIAPISAKVAHLADDIEDLAARARRVDDSVRDGVHNANRFVWSVATKAWPVVGAARAVKAGLEVLGRRPEHGHDDNISRPASRVQVGQFEGRKHNVS